MSVDVSKEKDMKFGDFSSLAENYAKFRPGYSETVLSGVLSLVHNDAKQIKFADVGAGTGIWSRMVARRGCETVAVEPNDEMRTFGEAGNEGLNIDWKKGSAEEPGLEDNAYDLISMASSFHWPDFERAIAAFNKALKLGGWFVALWNPRLLEVNPLLVDIENQIKVLVPDLKRVSSGRSEFCDGLTKKLYDTNLFNEVLYMEGRHVEKMSQERYLGVWRSVNDIRVQAGEERFTQFMNYIEDRIKDHEVIEATYATKLWMAQKK